MRRTRPFKILAALLLATVCFGQGYIQTPPPNWYIVGVGAVATRPVTCTANFHVFICNGAGCGTNGEYHYCTALNTWTVASGAGAGTINTIAKFTAATTLGDSALFDDGTQVYDVSARKFGFGTTALLSPIGKSQTVITSASPFIVGGATVGSYTAVTSPTANKDYLNKAGLGTASTVGNLVTVTGGTGVYTGMYRVILIVTANSIQVDRALHASGADVVDVAISMSSAYNLAVGTNRTFGAALLNAATGNEVAFRFDYTTNKAAGNDTGLQINFTDTASPGTSLLTQWNVGGNSIADIANTGTMTLYNSTAVTGTTTQIIRAGAGQASGSFPDLSQWINSAGTIISYVDWSGANYWKSSGNSTVAADNGGFRFNSTGFVKWYNATNIVGAGAYDIALSRTSAGLLQINGSTAGKWAGLQAGSVAMQSLATPVITSVTPSANNGVTCTYKLTAYLANGVISTDASAAVSTGAAGPTNCNSNTVVWTAAAAVSFYQLNRTVGGATQGTITAMGGAIATWANNTTNCPAGTCTYIDTGTAASGAASTDNATGKVTMAGGSANTVVCWRADGITPGYATVAEITAGTCH